MSRSSIALGMVIALTLHVLFGWIWAIAGSLVAGFLASSRPALRGAAALAGSWALLIGWNMAVAPAENLNMMETMGSLLGGMSGFVIPLSTLLIASLLGAVAGLLGGAIRPAKSD